MAPQGGTAEVDGEYIAAFTQQAGQVSPVFERKVQDVFESELGGTDEDEWYAIDSVVRAFQEIEQQAGEKTMEQGGIAAGTSLPWPPDVETVSDGFATLNEMHLAAYRGGSGDAPAGEFTFESLDSGGGRVGVTDGYPYPDAYARGALKGVVRDLTDQTANVTETDTRSRERTAWIVEW